MARLTHVKLLEGADGVLIVGNSTCLANAVHGEDGVAHIHIPDGEGRGEDVAEGAATCLGERLTADVEGVDGGVVFREVALCACLDALDGQRSIKTAIAFRLQQFGRGFYSQEVDGRMIQKVDELVDIGHGKHLCIKVSSDAAFRRLLKFLVLHLDGGDVGKGG